MQNSTHILSINPWYIYRINIIILILVQLEPQGRTTTRTRRKKKWSLIYWSAPGGETWSSNCYNDRFIIPQSFKIYLIWIIYTTLTWSTKPFLIEPFLKKNALKSKRNFCVLRNEFLRGVIHVSIWITTVQNLDNWITLSNIKRRRNEN